MSKQTLSLFGFDVFNESIDRALTVIDDLLKEGSFKRLVTLNPQIVDGAEANLILKKYLKSADLVVADGVGIKIAAKLLHNVELSIITGLQLFLRLLDKNKYSFYFVGTGSEQIEKVVSLCEDLCPGSKVLGYSHGFLSRTEHDAVIHDIVDKSPDFVFVGMGFPRQEYFIQSLSLKAKSGIAVGVGGVFDVISGQKRFAPLALRRLGLEWLFRGLQEPKRILTWAFLIRYFFIVLQQWFSKKQL